MKAIVFLLTACGPGVAQKDSDIVIAHLEARITSAETAPTSHTRAAVRWQRIGDASAPLTVASEANAFVTQDLGSAADVGVDFQLDVDALPPADAMDNFPAGSGCATAFGDFIIYEDGNDDHTLDLVSLDATSAPDRILGTLKDAANMGLSYWSPGCVGLVQPSGPTGFNWETYLNSPSGDTRTPVSQRVSLDLNATPAEQVMMCNFPPGAPLIGQQTVHGVYPMFDDATNLVCANDGSWTATYTYPANTACASGLSVTLHSYWVWSVPGGGITSNWPEPADWPCPIPARR